ncbi:MAG: lamin tail domain-containing protein, partial [Candidatus Paceibacteria bacterium]
MKWVGEIFLFLTLFLYGQVAFADVIITEIMYDVSGTDTDREWLEIYNAGEEGVDISKYKFFESSANHALSLFEGEAVLPKGGYAIIASNPTKFKTDWPAFTGVLFDSSFSLSNEGETLVIKDGNLEVTNEVTYDTSLGAGGDGRSLSKIN